MPVDTTEHAHGNNYCLDHPGLPDPALPPLTRRQADRMVQLALTAAAGLGLSLTYRGDAALVPADRSVDEPVLGLNNLARAVGHHEEDRWPEIVAEHLDAIVKQFRAGAPLPPDDPEHELIQRIVARDSLPAKWTADRPDFLPGLIAVPSTDDGGIITMFLEPADLGVSRPDADRFGLANLRRLQDEVTYVDDQDIRIAFVSGQGYAASRALVLDTVLRESLQVQAAPYGVLAALPARDTLILHVIEDLGVIPALGLMLNLAARCYARDPSPLSPEVYLVTPDLAWHPATTAPSDEPPLRLSTELEALAARLATREETH
ncbi:hypothetical protein JOF29_005839 [Kribbella aluminosa]|uniref:Uncharacterized protein n=1 Tax=Kribbella aluminosa TaxID=416017 RepID=A0ABS4UT59_9ACTN|nr:hypothetical protein [Kribbella aluminosa]MBP2354729.1 hypothetical protein [Kribbella aluminosa]